jgi:ribosomal protein S10/peptidoglycan hydrolase CwlO-like protein
MGNCLSEIKKFSSREVKRWLETETSSIFVPVHTKAQKLLGETRKAVENLSNTNKMLLDNSGKEIEKRNMRTYGRARALNKLARLFVDRIKQIKIPEEVTYDSVREFVQETQQAFTVTEVDIKNWFPRVSPFFILDRRRFLAVFEKAKDSLNELSDFLIKDYVKTKTLEETFQIIDNLQILEQQLTSLNDQKKKTEDEKASAEREIADTHQRMTDIRSRGSIGQLDQVDAEIKALSVEVKHSLRHLQKPFIKLQSLTIHSRGSGLTPEETGKLTQYLEKSFEAFATEDSDYPLLKEILQKLSRSMADGKLKLKPEKTRKAEQTVDDILSNNSLAGLHRKCVEATARKKQLSTSKEVAETQNELSKLNDHLENLKRKRERIDSEKNAVERAYNEADEEIRNSRSQIEKNILSFMNQRVRIE